MALAEVEQSHPAPAQAAVDYAKLGRGCTEWLQPSCFTCCAHSAVPCHGEALCLLLEQLCEAPAFQRGTSCHLVTLSYNAGSPPAGPILGTGSSQHFRSLFAPVGPEV